MDKLSYHRHRYPSIVIQQALWLDVLDSLSPRLRLKAAADSANALMGCTSASRRAAPLGARAASPLSSSGPSAVDCVAAARVRAPRSGPRGTGLSERRPLAVPRLERGDAPNRSVGETKFLPMNTACTSGRHAGLHLRRRSDERGCRRRSGSSLSLCFDICSQSLVRGLSWFRLNRPM